MSHRLEAPAGARIDRTRPLSFTFNGRVGGRLLGAGTYRLTATPVAHGVTGNSQTVSFELVG